jgi:hypothetical protein
MVDFKEFKEILYSFTYEMDIEIDIEDSIYYLYDKYIKSSSKECDHEHTNV